MLHLNKRIYVKKLVKTFQLIIIYVNLYLKCSAWDSKCCIYGEKDIFSR